MRRAKVFGMLAVVLALAGLGGWLVATRAAYGHCDTLGGPVVSEARAALEKGDVTPILKWVKKENEEQLETAFAKTLVVRSKGPEPKELADMYFYETLVRLHRAGEGAPYTGLKPAEEIEPPVAAADKAIDVGNVDDLAKRIGQAAEKGVRERFGKLMEAKKHKDESVAAGREYVEAYVVFVHHVEALHNVISAEGAPHHGDAEGKGAGKEVEGHAH